MNTKAIVRWAVGFGIAITLVACAGDDGIPGAGGGDELESGEATSRVDRLCTSYCANCSPNEANCMSRCGDELATSLETAKAKGCTREFEAGLACHDANDASECVDFSSTTTCKDENDAYYVCRTRS